jgi:predicted  nucleic acid-binding Zn-ribbon protein
MKVRIVPVAAGLAAAAGIALTGASLASADSTSPTSTTAAYGQVTPEEAPQGNGNTDPSKPMRSDETLLTGDVAAKVTAAAKAKEPTATIERVETDSDGVYEAHMVRTDGTHIIVQIDKSYAVTNVQVGGVGGPGGGGAAPAAPSGASSSAT